MSFWTNKKPKPENLASQEDIRKIREELAKAKKKEESQSRDSKGRFAGALKDGFGDIAESLSKPQSKRRMRIAQMAGRHAPIARMNISNPIAGRKAGIYYRHHISNAPREE